MKALRKTAFTVLTSAALVTSAYAASDGTLGATSTGTSDLEITTTEMAEITGLADLTVNPYGGSGGVDENDDVCIYTNDTANDHRYKVTATGSWLANGTAGNLFYLKNSGTTDTIAYTVEWNASTGPGNNALTANTLSAAFAATDGGTYPCPADNANFRVQADHNDIMSKPAGTYEATLTLVISPDNT